MAATPPSQWPMSPARICFCRNTGYRAESNRSLRSNERVAPRPRMRYICRFRRKAPSAPVAQLDRALPSEGKRKLFLLNISARKIE